MLICEIITKETGHQNHIYVLLKPHSGAQLTRAKRCSHMWTLEIKRQSCSIHLLSFYRKPACTMNASFVLHLFISRSTLAFFHCKKYLIRLLYEEPSFCSHTKCTKKCQVHIVSVHTVNDMTLIAYFHISPLGKDHY